MARPKNKESKYYVDNKELTQALTELINQKKYNDEHNLPPPRVPRYIGECIFKITNKLANRPNFINYTYKDEMIADAMEICVRYIFSFNPEKTNNAFSWFTTVAFNSFVARINKEKKQSKIKHKWLTMLDMNEEMLYHTQENDDTDYHTHGQRMNDYAVHNGDFKDGYDDYD